jgi:ectoine hydroxylase-related dioxygenase (phytanoyl-CoA dioxygenase family)
MRELRDATSILGDAQSLRKQFDEDGYIYAPQLVDVDRVNALAADVMEVLDGRGLLVRNERALQTFRETRTSYYYAVQRLESFHALPHDPALLRVVRALVGDDAFAHPQRLLRAILPEIPELVTPPHQDYAYIHGTTHTVTAWLPLRTCRVKDGALRILVGSHKGGLLALHADPSVAGSAVDADDNDPDWASTDLEPGDALLFDSMTVHSAQPNTSDRIRLSADYRFQSASEPVADRALKPSGYPRVPDWPELLADLPGIERWVSVPAGVEITSFGA